MNPRKPVLYLCALLLLAGCRPASDPKSATRAFLETIAEGRTNEAYASAAFSFRAPQSEKAFLASTRELGLIGARIYSIDIETATDQVAKVRVVLTSSFGTDKTFVFQLQPEAGAWRVFAVRSPPDPVTGQVTNHFTRHTGSLAFDDAAGTPPPDDRSMKLLVRESMSDFAQALAKQSFSDFYSHISQRWRAQVSQRQLERAFQDFITQGVNLTGVSDLGPVFESPPIISADNLLLAAGHFPTKPYEVVFAFKYVSESGEWKLFGLDVNLRQAAAAPEPAK